MSDDNRLTLVMGAASGIGFHTARELAARGVLTSSVLPLLRAGGAALAFRAAKLYVPDGRRCG
jgi:NAD(P)-dependent dehydrogenase (short-subunit alcohol dehydrogenase family)